MARKRSEEFRGGRASVQPGVRSFDGRRPGDISDIIAERRMEERARTRSREGANDTSLDSLAKLLSTESFVLSDKISEKGNRFINLWFEGDYQNDKLFGLLQAMEQKEEFPFFSVNAPDEHHPEYTTVGISAGTKAALIGLLDEGKLQFTQANRRSEVPPAFAELRKILQEPKGFVERVEAESSASLAIG